MNISGSLHLYSGDDRELFFTFDDDVARELYAMPQFDVDDIDSRRVYISVGNDRFIHRRTMSFSRKQSEIKVSLCKETTKSGLGALTRLYEWFAPSSTLRPKVMQVVGTLAQMTHDKQQVWELGIEEPVGLVSPPGLRRRQRTPSPTLEAYIHRRELHERELREIGTLAEKRAFQVLMARFPSPSYECLWRNGYLDSAKEEVRKQGIICDIDIWNTKKNQVQAFFEIKAQMVRSKRTIPAFFLSSAEWRSLKTASKLKVPYRIWLIQYESLDELKNKAGKIRILECDRIDAKWLNPEVLYVTPEPSALTRIA